MQAHDIGDYAPRLGSSGNDFTAGTHTERVDSPTIRRMTDELVGSSAQGRMIRKASILGTVNEPA